MKDTNNMIEGSTGSTPDSQPVTPHTCSPPPQARSDVPIPLNQPAFQRLPGETPRSYSAFIAWFQLGHSRSLQGVADNLDESISNIKKWSSRFAWSRRLQTFNAGLLQDQAAQIADANRKNTADWTQRLHAFREQEWDAAQKLLTAAQCFLESFGDEDVGKMTLSHVSRALRIASHIGRDALAGADLPDTGEPDISPAQQEMLHAIKKIYNAARSQPVLNSGIHNPVAATVPVAVEPGVSPGGYSATTSTRSQ